MFALSAIRLRLLALEIEPTMEHPGTFVQATTRDPAEHRERGRGAILMYHRVARLDFDVHNLCVTPANFKDHVAHLKTHYRPMPLADLVAASQAGAIPDGAVALTLDDGYLDALEHATPVLHESGVPATFYINTGLLDEPHETWWDTLARVFLSGGKLPKDLQVDQRGTPVTLPMENEADRTIAHEVLRGLLYEKGPADRDALLNEVKRWSGLDLAPRESHRVLTGSEIVQLASWPCNSIGVHTINHLSLPSQPQEVQHREIHDCQRELEQLLGRSITTFSYPYGEHSTTTAAVVRSLPFTSAVTVNRGLVGAGADPLLLPRFEIKDWTVDVFAAALRDALSDPVS